MLIKMDLKLEKNNIKTPPHLISPQYFLVFKTTVLHLKINNIQTPLNYS